MRQAERAHDLAAVFLIAAASTVLGLWFMPQIGTQYPPASLVHFIGYLMGQPGFWVAGLVASLLGLGTSHGVRFRGLTHGNLLALMVAWLVLGAALLGSKTGLWRGIPDALAASALVLLLILFWPRPFSREGIFRALRVALVAAVFIGLFSMVSFWHTIGKASIFLGSEGQDHLLEFADAVVLGPDFYRDLQVWRMANPRVVEWADWIYVAFMQQFIWAGFYFLFVDSDGKKRARIWTLAVFLAYFIGTLAYFIMPAYGPAFSRPELFSDLSSSRLLVDDLQGMLATNTARIQEGPIEVIPIFGFIAAMPSLHVGVTVIAALATSGVMRVLCWLWALATWMCTIILGWHWMWDGPAGIGLALLCWMIARRIVARSLARESPVLTGRQPGSIAEQTNTAGARGSQD